MKKNDPFFSRLLRKIIAIVSILLVLVCLALALTLLFPGRATAAQVTRINAGLYILDVQMGQDAPQADQPFTILIIPQDNSLRLAGQVIETPVSGTDAANVYVPLVPQAGQANALKGELHIPVRGFWQLVLELDGPRGHGSATIPVVVTAPGAMPVWLAWSIGSLPALGLLWWIKRQRIYQRALLVQAAQVH
jgi:hypothetical protein